ncbi:MAG: response regulator receiver [Bacteroidetes bacterium]|nr:response regulator receiver [Bacteroidota bacterium]
MKKILVVEDDYILAMVQAKFIQKMGFTVVASVTNGIDAIEAVKKYSPDIIIMDVRIDGDMDGVQTMMEIRKFSEVPVIYSTGNSESALMERAKDTNMKGFFVKPVNYNELETLIKSA